MILMHYGGAEIENYTYLKYSPVYYSMVQQPPSTIISKKEHTRFHDR